MNHKSRWRIFKDRPVQRSDIEEKGNICVITRDESIAMQPAAPDWRLYPNASSLGPAETLIAERTFDCSSATRYANSPLFPDRVLKA